MDNIRRQYAKNAEGLASLLAKAERTGKKANGFTADQLRSHLADYRRLATATDDELRAHFAERQTLAAQRLIALKNGDTVAVQSLTTRIAAHQHPGVLPLSSTDVDHWNQ